MLPLVFLMGVGMHSTWRTGNLRETLVRYKWLIAVSLAAGILVPVLGYGAPGALTLVGVTAAVWLILMSLAEPAQAVIGRARMSRARAGMHVAHLGVGVFTLGVAFVTSYGIEADRSIRAGERLELGGYEFTLRQFADVQGPNYDAIRGTVDVTRAGQPVATLLPEKRRYRTQQSPMTEAGIDAALSRDLFVALGDPLGDGAWSVRVQYKPMIRLIWLGCIIMALGGLLAMTDRRYRVRESATAGAATRDAPAAAAPRAKTATTGEAG